MPKPMLLPVVILTLGIVLIFSCSERSEITNSSNLIQIESAQFNAEGLIKSASYQTGQVLQGVNQVGMNQLSRTGCDNYPFVDPVYSWPHEYMDLTFMGFPGYEPSQGYVQMEGSSSLIWYPFMIALPDPATSINWDVLDNEHWEDWYLMYRAIGCTIFLFDDEMNLLASFETVTNSDWQNVTHYAPDNSAFKYIGIVGKYSEDETDPYAALYARFKNVTLCWAQPCAMPELTLDASQTTIWPPNHKTISVYYSGNITNDCGDAEYELLDEYGELTYSGTLEPGDYNLALDLVASRQGTDKDGRKYTFTLTTSNDVGSATESVDVTVLHSFRKQKR